MASMWRPSVTSCLVLANGGGSGSMLTGKDADANCCVEKAVVVMVVVTVKVNTQLSLRSRMSLTFCFSWILYGLHTLSHEQPFCALAV